MFCLVWSLIFTQKDKPFENLHPVIKQLWFQSACTFQGPVHTAYILELHCNPDK